MGAVPTAKDQTRKLIENKAKILEARVGIEPTHKGFADLSLTTWVPRRQSLIISNSRQACQPAESWIFGHFLTGDAIRASRKKRADSSGGVGLM